MTQTEIQLLSTIVAGFLLLALSVGAFALHRSRIGVLLLVLAAVATLLSYPLIGQVSRDQQESTRQAIEAKYDFEITEWSAPLGDSPIWVIDGRPQSCEVDLSDRDDPVLECTDPVAEAPAS
ncbi:hypothetical protein KM427_12030 [Nocardioides sp. LMS-CY]|uniref:Uncharacterized protein n=1 Tax=Nocardioides soli TaxID=1036020 RepID=A0A7W4W0W7_9ACTN|nr:MULTISPECIES: hypothetical protein [Nocardioides]MBB3044862.1 hypothetical protein [Nocardioides soli]QWF24353.1 hypothetical protein KM427_12030 [Nocardioides sp. LMS-CY]